MQAAHVLQPMPAPIPGSVLSSGRRANAAAPVAVPPDLPDRTASTSRSSVAEGDLSRSEMDRRRSNIGPRAVHLAACAGALGVLRQRLGAGYVKRVSCDLDVPHGTVKKWFLGQTRPHYARWLQIQDVYAELLADAGQAA